LIKAIIHAGGESSRMQSVFRGSKALLPIGKPKKPILWYHMQPLINSGIISEYIFTLRAFKESVENYVKKLEKEFKIKTKIIVEPIPLGRAGSIKYGIENDVIDLKETYLMSHPDDLIPINIRKLVKFQTKELKKGKIATLVMAKYARSQFGIGKTNKNKELLEIEEKPELPLPKNYLASTGMCLYTPKAMKLFKKLKTNVFCHPETTVLPKLVKERKIAVFEVEKWISVNYKDDYLRVKDVNKNKLVNFLLGK
jgi:NDP-sugar pyrophosphorylase family protein